MKYTITINQSAIFINGLINKTDVVDWMIIDYLKDFVIYKKSKRITYQGEGYIWLNYNHMIASLPLAKFKGTWTVSRRISKLRNLGLIKTVKDKDNTLYYTFMDKLIDVIFAKQSDIERLRKANATCLCAVAKRQPPKQSPTDTTVKVGDCHADARNDNGADCNPIAKIATRPIASSATDPIASNATAQYKTKNTIINKDNNNDISFSSFSSFKNRKTRQDLQDNKENPEKKIRLIPSKKDKNPNNPVKGFTSLNGNVWKVLANIRQRQYANSKCKSQNAKLQIKIQKCLN